MSKRLRHGLCSLSEGRLCVALGAASLLSATGCSGVVEDGSTVSQQKSALSSSQGVSLQGISLQGISLQGISLQGISLQGISLQGTSLQGTSLQGTSLQGTSLQGTSLQGTSLQGTSLDGSQTSLPVGTVLSSNRDPSLQLRIAAVKTDWQDPSGEITLYSITAWDAKAAAWKEVCAADPWGERWAIAVAGRWDESGTHQPDPAGFTFACTSGVIAKCVRWGYKPWKTLNGTDLAPYHQACTRMARADYCGDGTAHTVNGTLIDLYDTLGIQARTPDVTDMFFEGTWTPDGAYCLGKVRWQNLAVTEPEGVCYKKLKWLSGTLLNDIDECEVKVQPGLKRSVLLYNRSRLNSL